MRDILRVVVTGMGVVSPLGSGVKNFWASLCQGKSGIGPLTRFDTSKFIFKDAGEVKDFTYPEEVKEQVGEVDLATQFVMVAANEAGQEACLDDIRADADKIGVVLATNFGGVGSAEELLGSFIDNGEVDPLSFKEYSFQAAADHLADYWKVSGPRVNLSLSCASGTGALGYASALIRTGRAKAVLAGGYDALSRFSWSGLSALRTMTKDKLRPFDKRRSGTIFGEGAAILILEELEQARARGAPIYAEVAGYGLNNNAYHMTAPAKEGAGSRLVMEMALVEAGLKPEEIDHINAHGTGTKYNDLTETQAIKALFGKGAYQIPINAIKSMTSHTMGAAGAMEAIAAIMTLREGSIPPTINYEEADPDCDLNYTPNAKLEKEVRVVLSNSAGIGGCNAAIIFKRLKE